MKSIRITVPLNRENEYYCELLNIFYFCFINLLALETLFANVPLAIFLIIDLFARFSNSFADSVGYSDTNLLMYFVDVLIAPAFLP